MILSARIRSVYAFILAVFVASQIMFVANVLLLPKPAEALIPVGITYNIYDILKDIGIAAGKQAALRFVDGFLTRFMNKVVEKYRIRNFVYYDQVLSDYYLTNYIREKISDPDLKNIFLLLDSAYVAGNQTGYTGYNPANAVIPQLKNKIHQIYLSRGGIDSDIITNPGSLISEDNYLTTLQLYGLNPESDTEQDLRSDYARYQSATTTASQLEIIVGGGYKSGRLLGGSCTSSNSPLDASDQSTCSQAGGTWNPSALDVARSVIDNPGQFAHDFVNETINILFDNNYNSNNSVWSAVGSLLGNFLYNKLALNNNSGVLPDGGSTYASTTGPATPKAIDLDGDGITDAYDYDGDGAADICVFSGTAPNCTTSQEATTPPDTSETPVACSAVGPQEQNFILPRLNALVSDNPVTLPPSQNYQSQVQAVAAELNQQFSLATGNEAVYYSDSNTVGLPEFYAAGPTPTRPVSPSTGQPWDIVVRCINP